LKSRKTEGKSQAGKTAKCWQRINSSSRNKGRDRIKERLDSTDDDDDHGENESTVW
jgi:hypothetical protein